MPAFRTIEALRTILRDTIEPMLAADGFHRLTHSNSHPTVMADFIRDGDRMLHVVDVQRSKWWTATKGEFRLGFGILVPAWNDTPPGPDENTLGYCWISLRDAIPRDGPWLTIDHTTDLPALRQEIVRQWQVHAAPWFQARATWSMLVDALEQDGASGDALAGAIHLRDMPRSRRLLRRVVEARLEGMLPVALKHSVITHAEHQKLQWAIIQDIDTLRRTADEMLGGAPRGAAQQGDVA